MRPLDRIDRLMLHCSDTDDGPTLSWTAIRRYHMTPEAEGGPRGGPWDDIGYHFGLEDYHGQHVLLPGRPVSMRGAHCPDGGRNADSLGLCIVGRFDQVEPSPTRFRATVDALALLAFVFGVAADRIDFHRDYNPRKTCPGLRWNRDDVRDAVARRLRDAVPPGRHLNLDLVRLP